ncbi:response regulator transcription factor [Kordiimonas sp.]|uniref:response regulator transcription factor n=1 Tax=Kordiimonas sp. TaxID=1970157 RepID=UPI003A93F1C6
MRVLIVEDNLDIQANIADYLEEDYLLDFAYSGDQGLELAVGGGYDVIVLDVMLPGRDGLEVCSAYRRAAGLQAPIIMLTARDTIDDKEAGFVAGADDYLVKPFSLRELKMRIDALALRPKSRNSPQRFFAGLTLDVSGARAQANGTEKTLHDKEVKILALLIEAAPDVVSAADISYALWGDEPPESGALRTHIYNLRRALFALGLPELLMTIRGKGYALKEDT